MDITWTSIFKVLAAGLATYIIMPAILVFRDLLLWKLVKLFILNNSLRKAVREEAILVDKWNSEFASESFTPETNEELRDYMARRDSLLGKVQDKTLSIDRKNRLLGSMLKQYKHPAPNPIQDWRKDAKKEVEQRKAANKPRQRDTNT